MWHSAGLFSGASTITRTYLQKPACDKATYALVSGRLNSAFRSEHPWKNATRGGVWLELALTSGRPTGRKASLWQATSSEAELKEISKETSVRGL